MNNLTLITGAVRSGKSRFAEEQAKAYNGSVTYLATMPKLPGDSEQERRIALHRQRRPPTWKTVECPNNLPQAIQALSGPGLCIIDCLSLYVSNTLIEALASLPEPSDPYLQDEHVLAAAQEVLQAIKAQPQVQFLVVTNETGWGVVPETPLGRAFRDFLGIVSQRFAAEAREVYLTCVGIPLRLKPPTAP